MKKYIAIERVDLFEPNAAIAMVFTISGDISEEKLRNAFLVAMQANETLQSRIVMDKDGAAWYETSNKIENTITVSNDSWRDILKEQEKVRFSIEKGELLRIFLMREDNCWRVLLLAHHLAGDGKSIVYFIEDVMNALNGKKLNYKEIKLLSPEELPKGSSMPFMIRMYVNRLNRKWKKTGRVFTFDDYHKMHKKYWENHNTVVFTEHFSAEELDDLKRCAKKIGVKLTSYIMTAFYQLMPVRTLAGLAVDGRPDKNRCMGNQTTGISVDYCYNAKRSYAFNAACIQKKMSQKLQSKRKKYFVLHFISGLDRSLLDSVTMCVFGGYQNEVSEKLAKVMGYEKVTMDLSITNLTKLDIPNEYGKYKIGSFLFIPPIISYGKRLIGIATLGNEMNISYHIMQDEQTDKEEKYFYQVMKKLKDISKP